MMKTHNHWTEYSNAPEKHLTKNMQFYSYNNPQHWNHACTQQSVFHTH